MSTAPFELTSIGAGQASWPRHTVPISRINVVSNILIIQCLACNGQIDPDSNPHPCVQTPNRCCRKSTCRRPLHLMSSWSNNETCLQSRRTRQYFLPSFLLELHQNQHQLNLNLVLFHSVEKLMLNSK